MQLITVTIFALITYHTLSLSLQTKNSSLSQILSSMDTHSFQTAFTDLEPMWALAFVLVSSFLYFLATCARWTWTHSAFESTLNSSIISYHILFSPSHFPRLTVHSHVFTTLRHLFIPHLKPTCYTKPLLHLRFFWFPQNCHSRNWTQTGKISHQHFCSTYSSLSVCLFVVCLSHSDCLRDVTHWVELWSKV